MSAKNPVNPTTGVIFGPELGKPQDSRRAQISTVRNVVYFLKSVETLMPTLKVTAK